MEKNAIILSALLICLAPVPAQAATWENFESFKTDIILHPSKAAALSGELMQKIRATGSPLIEGDHATFIYENKENKKYADTVDICVAGDFNDWSKDHDELVRLPGTKIYYRTYEFPSDARFDYQFVIGGDWILDPNNPHTAPSGFGLKSELRMPAYQPARELEPAPSGDRGAITELKIYSDVMKEQRHIKVYLPAGFDRAAQYATLYVHDGYEFIDYAHLNNVLDNLINQKRIVPLIAIFIPPAEGRRTEEYFTGDTYARFVAEELVPFIDDRYPTVRHPRWRGTVGISYGGSISLTLGTRWPDVFGVILAQSPAIADRGTRNNFLKEFGVTPKKNLKVYLDVGTYEWESMVEYNRMLKRILEAGDYPHLYREWNEGHAWANWRTHIGRGLEFVWGL